MNLEEQLKRQFGNSPHFKVPEGYFQNFNMEVMELIESEENDAKHVTGSGLERATVRLMRPLRWVAAACVVGAVIGLGLFFGPDKKVQDNVRPSGVMDVSQQQDEIDQAIDNYMINEYEAYDLLAEY